MITLTLNLLFGYTLTITPSEFVVVRRVQQIRQRSNAPPVVRLLNKNPEPHSYRLCMD